MTNLNVKVPEISFESASIENINMASKWTSKGAATAVTSCLLEKNDSENADEYFESSDDEGIDWWFYWKFRHSTQICKLKCTQFSSQWCLQSWQLVW